jgi:hypothetical protein
MKFKKSFVVGVFSLFAVSCGGDKGPSPSPTSPTPPPPAAMTLSMASDWPAERVDSSFMTGNGNAMGVTHSTFRAADGNDGGAIWIAIKATASNVGAVRGELKWDRSLLTFDGYAHGDWFKQDGALVTWSLLTSTPGQVGFLLDRPSTLSGATGTGTVIHLRLRAVARGTSQLQWSNPSLRGTDFSARPLVGGIFGGSVTIQ